MLGQVVTIVFVEFGLEVALPLSSMLAVVMFLVVLNGISLLRHRSGAPTTGGALLLELLLDVAALTTQLYLSGGASNPFVSLYLLQVILAAVLLEARPAWILVGVTTVCFVGLTLSSRPLALPHRHDGEPFGLHLQGMFIAYVLAAGLIVFFVTRIGRNLRERDARLAALRQRSVEEELVVRMGLLASGAAHELGTPLGTLSVIVNDWQRMPALTADPELAEDLDAMGEQLLRCKEIVSKILTSSGEMRGEGAGPTTVARFFDALVEDWRTSRWPPALHYDNRFAPDQAIATDAVLAQGIANVFDNALEASPDWMSIVLGRDGDAAVLTVEDRGPGFADRILAQFGKPYQTTKTRPGSGLGLFLLVNVARKLGGEVTAENRTGGGARVVVRLPLARLALETRHGG